jgi:hypothetical protein
VRFRVDERDVTGAARGQGHAGGLLLPARRRADPGHLRHRAAHAEAARAREAAPALARRAGPGPANAADRIAAAKGLHKHTSGDVVAALERALGGDPFWGVRAARRRDPRLAPLGRGARRADSAPSPTAACTPRRAGRCAGRWASSATTTRPRARWSRVVRARRPQLLRRGEACLALGQDAQPRAPARRCARPLCATATST